MSTGCTSDHHGFVTSASIPHLWKVKDVVMKWPSLILSYLRKKFVMAAFLRMSTGCSTLHKTGSHERGEGRRVPDMSRILLFSLASTIT